METHRPLRAALAAALLIAASAAHSQIYRWVDEQGSIAYSNEPPTERSTAHELTLIDDGSSRVSPTEQRTREILEAERAATSSAPRNAGLRPYGPAHEIVVAPGSTPDMAPLGGAEPPRISASPSQPEAVRDPCLLSADPRCYERNRDNYVPYRGYSPSTARAMRQDTLSGIGGISGIAAGGAVAGGAPPPPPKLVAPKASTYALPPGSDMPVSLKR